MTVYFDKLIDNYLPTDSGWAFHPDNIVELPTVESDNKLVIDTTNPLPNAYSQLMFSTTSSTGNAYTYYLNLIASTNGELPQIVKDANASNAKAIKIGANTKLIFKTNYPYNKDRLKKVVCRCRKEAGTTASLRVGVISIKDEAYITPSGSISTGDFYDVTINSTTTVSETYNTYIGYVLGTTTNAYTPSVPDVDYPIPLYEGTTDIALVIEVTDGIGNYYIDSIELQDTENSVADLPNGKYVVNSLEGLSDDNKLSPVEKAYIKTLMSEIDAEYAGILADGTDAGVSDTLLADLETKYTALYTIVYPLLVDMTKASEIDSTFDSAFNEYYAIKTSVESEIAELTNRSIALLEGLTDDNQLSPVEKTYIKTLMSEIDAEYIVIVADGTDAGISSTSMTNLETKYNALHTIVDPVLVDMTKVSDIDSTFDLAFDEYYAIKTSIQSEVARLTMRSITLTTDSNVVMYSREKGYSPATVILRAHTFNVPANEITWSAMVGATPLTLSPVPAEGSTVENPIYKEYFRSFTTDNLPFNDVIITATVANPTLEATVSVSIMESPFDPPLYFGVSATPPNTEGKKIGDHYLDTENIPWRFDGLTWVEVLSGDNAPSNYSEIMANVLADALNSENTIPSTSVIYGYFESIVAHRLLVTDDAKSFQFNVSPDGYTHAGVKYPIFEITVPNPNNPSERKQLLSIDGYKKELQVDTNGTFNGEIVSNAITSTIGTPPANKAHTVTTKNVWYSTDIYNGVGGISVNSALTSISGGFRSKSIVKAGKLTSSTSTLLVETYSNTDSARGSGFSHYATKTVPAGATQVYFNVSVSDDTWPGGGEAKIVIYRGSTSIASFESSGGSNIGPYNVQYGDVIQYYSEGYWAWGTSRVNVTSNFRAAPRAQGLYLVYSDNSTEILRTGRWYDTPFTLGAYSSTYNLITGQRLTTEIIKDIKADTWNLCGSGSTCKIQTFEQSSASTYNVIEVKATSSFIDFNTTSGHKIISIWNSSPTSSVGVYKSLSYSLNIANTPDKVTVASVYPKDSSATIGSSANPFSAGAFQSLSTDSASIRGREPLLTKTENGYPGIVHSDNTDSNWLRTTVNGLLPYASGGASALGSSSWPFNNGYFKSLDVTGSLAPCSNPVAGSQSIRAYSYYTPPRGLYNSSMGQSNRGSGFSGLVTMYETSADTDTVVFGGDGPYAGTSTTRVYNQYDKNAMTWYYAKF